MERLALPLKRFAFLLANSPTANSYSQLLVLLFGLVLSVVFLSKSNKVKKGIRSVQGSKHSSQLKKNGELTEGEGNEQSLKLEEWYPGRWYEIAGVTSKMDKFVRWTTNNSIDFTMLPDGSMDLAASCYNRSFLFGEKSRRFNSGTATFSGVNMLTWNMSLLNGLVNISFPIKVRFVDPSHQWLVLSPGRNMDRSVYICSRKPFMHPTELKKALQVVKSFGYDLKKISPTQQTDPYEDVFMLPTVRRYNVLSLVTRNPSEVSKWLGEPGRLMLSPFVFRGGFSDKYVAKVVHKFFDGCVRGDMAFVYDFVQREPLWVDARDDDQWMCLHFAAYNGHMHLAKYVLEQGASVNGRTKTLEVPLFLAVKGMMRHALERIQWQRDESASAFNLKGGDERYSYRPHSLWYYQKTIEALLKHGANTDAMDSVMRLKPMELLDHVVAHDQVLYRWVLQGEDQENPVRNEVVGAIKDVRNKLSRAHKMNVSAPVRRLWLRYAFLLLFISLNALKVVGTSILKTAQAVLVGIRFIFLFAVAWFGLRPLGYIFYRFLYPCLNSYTSRESFSESSSPAEPLGWEDKYARFRAKCLLFLVLAMKNPTIHKIAQILSSRPDIVDSHVASEFQILRENVPPMTEAELEDELTRAFGKDRSHIFEYFEMEPIASGTIAQVHRAKLAKDGPLVAVKVVRQSIRGGLERVLKLVNLLLSLRFFYSKPLFDRSKRVYALILCQTDMMLEAASIKAMQRACDRSTGDKYRIPRIPRVYSLVTSRNVLTMELIEDHLPISQYKDLAIPGELIAMRLSHFHLRCVFIDGLFHCDLHPGNIFLDPKDIGRMTLLDFGLVGELEVQDRINYTSFFLASLSGEWFVAVEVFRKHFAENSAEVLKTQDDIDAFNRDLEPVLRYNYQERSEWDLNGTMQDLDRVMKKHGLQGTSLWASIELSLVAMQGTLTILDAHGDLRVLYEQFITSNYSALLRSVSSSQYYERLERKVMEKFGWGAILCSAGDPGVDKSLFPSLDKYSHSAFVKPPLPRVESRLNNAAFAM